MASDVSVEIIEVGPRDGLQNESRALSTADKAELVERGFAAGCIRVEVTSFVHPNAVPALADAERVMELVPRRTGRRRTALVLNRRGLARAVAAGADEIGCVLVATETFSQRNQRLSIEETLAEITAIVDEAPMPVSVTIAAAFGCPFEGRVDQARVLDLAARVADLGVEEISLADTIGVGDPNQVKRLFEGLAQAAPDIRRRGHFHNTRNTGYANAVAAVAVGVDALDAAAGGLGGCPFAPGATGNIATEDLLYLLHAMGVSTGISLNQAVETARWLQQRLGGAPLAGQLSRAGEWPATLSS